MKKVFRLKIFTELALDFLLNKLSKILITINNNPVKNKEKSIN